MLAYSKGKELFLAKADGSESHRLMTMKDAGFVIRPVWSPDGVHLRFDFFTPPRRNSSIWEVSTDGTQLRQLLPGVSKAPPDGCCGNWTADGNYFLFVSGGQIWALPEKRSVFRAAPSAVQLTSSPMALGSPLPGRDGKGLFVTGRTFRGELMRYDSKSRAFSAFLGGISAEFVDFSKDGQWVAYVSYPEGTLWRSTADGSDQLQLSYPPGYAVNPRWSPDGKSILFYEIPPNRPSRILEVSPEGGSPRELIPEDKQGQWDPNWSPEGNRIVFARDPTETERGIQIFDLAAHRVSTVPGSQGFYSPRWSPTGQYLVALSADETTLFLFNFQTQKWTELAKGFFTWPNFSKDGQYLYILTVRGASAVLKIRLADGRTERVADLKDFVYTGRFVDGWLSLAPDDSPLLFRDAGASELYSLDWEEP